MNEKLSDRNRREQEALKATIAERLGHIGIDGYHKMPRKTKKALKKDAQSRHLTQIELSRLSHINSIDQEEQNNSKRESGDIGIGLVH